VHDERRPADVVLLNLSDFRVLAAVEVEGELEVTVETTATRTGCPDCGVVASLHNRRETVVRDVDAFGRRATLRWGSCAHSYVASGKGAVARASGMGGGGSSPGSGGEPRQGTGA
jgi:hypothetical protein